MSFERYREIVPDFDLFLDTMSRPEPTTIRVRTGRIEAGALLGRLEEQGFRLRPMEGQPDLFQVEREPEPIARTIEHWLGLFYVQRASTGVAAPVLGPRPGERVLDLCAAPGGKTTHMADLMRDRGPLVAVEPNEARIRALAGNIYRTAHVNVMTVAADGRFLPGGALFDRVLVDAPCSAEGTARGRSGRPRNRTERFESYITNLQEGLLRRAIELTRPGGSILYATCTFAPEENEAVVDAVLKDMPVDLVPVSPAVPSAPGLTSFEGRRFDDRLWGAARIYPHQLDSGGLFLALLQKAAPPEQDPASGETDTGWKAIPVYMGHQGTYSGEDPPASLRAEERIRSIESVLGEFWNIEPGALDGIDWLIRNDRVWAHGCREWPFESWKDSKGWSFVAAGLRSFSFDTGGYPRPSNDLLRWLGTRLGRRRIELTDREWVALLDTNSQPVPGTDDGYSALLFDGLPIGRGFVRGERVRHEIPRVHADNLQRVLARRPIVDHSPDAPGVDS